MRVCPKCGRENPDYLVSCVDCGANLTGKARAIQRGVLFGGLAIVGLAVISGAFVWRRPLRAAVRGTDGPRPAPGRTQAAYATFRTAGIPEAHGVDFTFCYPAGWAPMKMPGGVCGFRYGNREFMEVNVVDPGRPVTDALFLEQVERPDVIKGLEDGATHRRKALVQRAPFPCISLDYDIAGTNGWNGHVREFVLEIGGKIVELTFVRMGGPADPPPERAEMMAKIVQSIRKERAVDQ